MAKKKLIPFTADDASDTFTPSVTTFSAAKLDDDKEKTAKEGNSKKSAVSKTIKSKKESKATKTKVATPPKSKKEAVHKIEENQEDGDKAPKDRDESKPGKGAEEKPAIVKSEKKAPAAPVGQSDTASVSSPKKKRITTKSSETADKMIELVGFILDEEEFAIDIQKVQDINRAMEITPVPRTPDFIEGVINLRGNVIPVISLRKRFGLEETEFGTKSRIVIVEVSKRTVGFVVDSVSEVIRIPYSTVEAPPDIVAGIDADYIEGIGKLEDRLLILLDLEKILATEKMEQMKDVC